MALLLFFPPLEPEGGRAGDIIEPAGRSRLKFFLERTTGTVSLGETNKKGRLTLNPYGEFPLGSGCPDNFRVRVHTTFIADGTITGYGIGDQGHQLF